MNTQLSPESKPLRSNEARNIETEIRRRYRAMRSGVPNGTPITVLHIGTEQTAIATGGDAEPAATLALEIGSQKTAADYFKHSPPTPDEMEIAIMAVEDEVTACDP